MRNIIQKKKVLTYRCKSNEKINNFSKEDCLSYRDNNYNINIYKNKTKIKSQNYFNKRN